MVDHLLIVQWVIGSIPLGGPSELYLVPDNVPQQRMWYVLSCFGEVHIKEPLK